MTLRFFLLLLLLVCQVEAITPQKRKTLLSSLKPRSASQHLAFYQLYQGTPEGQIALQRAWKLLSRESQDAVALDWIPSPHIIQTIISLINRQPTEKLPDMTPEDLRTINRLSKHFANRKLKGYGARSEADILALPSEEIDLARGLFLSQLGREVASWDEIAIYEAMIDLMALQIQAKLDRNAAPEEIIQTMNRFIFEEMQFRFPPHSAYAKDIDLYTFLPTVLDSRRGVCLGVSILYLCLAQRLNVPLEIITPPGHIYVRYRHHDHIINIETTARGIDVDSEQYLSLNTRKLQKRNLKETIGFAHVNQASLFWNKDDVAKTLNAYEIALKYLPEDTLVQELYAYSLIVNGQKEKGKAILEKLKTTVPDYAVVKETLCSDYLEGKTDESGILSCFMFVDEDRGSLLEKKTNLQKLLGKYPEFKSGLFQLAATAMQLHQEGEALEVLKKYHNLDANNPTVEYFLTVLNTKRFDHNNAWRHLKEAERIVTERDHHPKALKELRKQLAVIYPE